MSFERSKNGKDEWLTPPFILQALGVFDTDPCSPIVRPWDTAKKHYTIQDNGLLQPWEGRVWCNPPYGTQTRLWLKRMRDHQNGIALIFARTETKNFFDYIWNDADGIMFLAGRLTFYNTDGTKAKNSAGSPSCLVAYGKYNIEAIAHSNIMGKLIYLK